MDDRRRLDRDDEEPRRRADLRPPLRPAPAADPGLGFENEKKGRRGMTRDAASLFEELPALLDADEWLVHRGRFFSGGVGIGIGDVSFHLEVERGRVAELRRGRILMRSTLFRM